MRRWPQLGLVWQFAIVGLIATAAVGLVLARVLGNVITQNALQEAAHEARDALSARVLGQLSPADLSQPMTGERYAEFQRFVDDSVVSGRTARIKIWNRDGTVVYSDESAQVGQRFAVKEEMEVALNGQTTSEISGLKDAENVEELDFGRLLEVYTPIVFPGSSEVAGAFEIYQYYQPVARQISETKAYLYSGLAGGLAVLYLALFAIVKRGAETIRGQQMTLHRRAEELQRSRQETLLAMGRALDMRDVETQNHSLRVQQLALAIGRQMNLPPMESAILGTASLLHDVGKIGVPDHILLKSGRLSAQEWQAIQRHPELGYLLLRDFEFLRPAAEIVYAHHERYDGTGYPRGLAGEDIHLGARVFAVADAYDGMTSNRPYRKALSHREAVEEIRRNSGSQFDPEVVEVFLKVMAVEPWVFQETRELPLAA